MSTTVPLKLTFAFQNAIYIVLPGPKGPVIPVTKPARLLLRLWSGDVVSLMGHFGLWSPKQEQIQCCFKTALRTVLFHELYRQFDQVKGHEKQHAPEDLDQSCHIKLQLGILLPHHTSDGHDMPAKRKWSCGAALHSPVHRRFCGILELFPGLIQRMFKVCYHIDKYLQQPTPSMTDPDMLSNSQVRLSKPPACPTLPAQTTEHPVPFLPPDSASALASHLLRSRHHNIP